MSMVKCEVCGKKLIERAKNGLWMFKFGKREGCPPVVEMEVHGSIRIKCLRRSCQHINTLNFFPININNPEDGKKIINDNSQRDTE